MTDHEKLLRSKLEDLDLKGDQVEDIMEQINQPKPPEIKDDTLQNAQNMLQLDTQILNETDPMKKAILTAQKISFKLDNYIY